MMLSGGEPVRQSTGVTKTWAEWHRHTDGIDQLCSIIQEGEELAAIRAMAGQAFLDTQTVPPVYATNYFSGGDATSFKSTVYQTRLWADLSKQQHTHGVSSCNASAWYSML